VRSKVAEELRCAQAGDDARLTPSAAVALALRLGERAVADYVANFGGSEEEAVAALRRAGGAGRRPSACLDEGGRV
jgi:hypothetical protein